jgi:hypothetical protein
MDDKQLHDLKSVFQFWDHLGSISMGLLGVAAGAVRLLQAKRPNRFITLFPGGAHHDPDIEHRLAALEKGHHELRSAASTQQEFQRQMHEANQQILTTIVKRQDDASCEIHSIRKSSDQRMDLLLKIWHQVGGGREEDDAE